MLRFYETFTTRCLTTNNPSTNHCITSIKKRPCSVKRMKPPILFSGVFVDVVDDGGHSYGPNSKELKDIIRQTDEAIKQMLDMLVQEGLEDKVNIVIFSDHGMTEISESRTIDISDHIGYADVEAVRDKGAVCSIWPREGKLEKVSIYFLIIKLRHQLNFFQKRIEPKFSEITSWLLTPTSLL